MRLVDYKVRILTPRGGHRGGDARDDRERATAQGAASGRPSACRRNIIDASYDALHDAITYKLFHRRRRVSAGRMSDRAPVVILCRPQMGEKSARPRGRCSISA